MRANDVSSKSWAWPAAPLASAAHVGGVRSEAPTTVQSGVPPSARATSRTIRAIGSVLPASMTPIESSAARRTLAMASRGQSSRRVLTTNSAIRAMALMAVDYSPELSPLASPPSCLRQLGGVSARTTLFRVVEDHAQRVAGTGGEAADAVAHGDAVPAALASRRPLPRGEDHQLSLLGGDGLAPGLGARALLDQQELSALVVEAAAAEEG